MWFLAPLFFLLAGCSGPYLGQEVLTAREFVLDSYQIKEGKFSILEMQGAIEPPPLSPDALLEYRDAISEDDLLTILLYHPKRDDLAKAVSDVGERLGYPVQGGKVYLPDLPGIQVAGLSLIEAKQAIETAYREEIAHVEIFLGYKDRIARKVELAGLVAIPSVPVDGKIRLFDVLARARVPLDANLFKSYVLREGQVLRVDLFKLLKEGDMSQNIVMRGQDKIYIAEPSSATLMVMGEVSCERVIALPHGYLPLRQALAEAGGIPYTGDKSYIQVIRGSLISPKIYTLSWEHLIRLPSDSLLVMPGDIVFVAPKPITEWNRFISQLMPSLSGVDAVGRTSGTVGALVP